ncbi:uncharacterized protein EDB93DRAFT_1117175 [Suillus bovinus]|uniref:uncharacterized protein n=1 Tax=Suillus bovinus TaxID=48563 RepID=UPI001B86A212|nr:uncharacterized protein EDB93DRAFT_1117175 [Suillus bovinus]KAG2158946.1 hypothetical protein EDB93DRAFT_1117175 [Suillus bovinus]
MTHPSSTPSKALPSAISDASVQSQNNHSAGHHVQWSDPLVYTRGIPARESQGANPAFATAASSVTSDYYPSRHDTGTIAGAMECLNLAPTTSSASSASSNYKPPPQTYQPLCPQLTGTSQAAHQGSSIIAMPKDPNLRFVFLRRLQAAQARGPVNPTDSSVIHDSYATAEPQSLVPVVSEAVLNQSNDTVESTTTDVNGTPPLVPTVTEDIIDLSLGNAKKNGLLQKEPTSQKGTEKQRNTQILLTFIDIKADTAKRRLDLESSDASEGGPQKRLKQKGALQPRLHSDSATSDVSPGPRSSIEPTSSSGRFSSSSVEVTDEVIPDGPKSIADAYNNCPEPSVSLDDTRAPTHSARGSGVSDVVRSYKRPALGGSTAASSSRVKVEDIDMEVSDDEVEADPQRAWSYAAAISQKVRMWAKTLKRIRHARLESLFDDNVEIMSKGEILNLLKEIDENKDWATRAEVEDARLEKHLTAVLTEYLMNGTEAYNIGTRILDNFAQRFRGERYPQTRR